MFRNVLHSESLGIIILDYLDRRIMFQNDCALDLIKEKVVPGDYAALENFFATGFQLDPAFQLESDFKSVRIGSRTIGYSLRRESERFSWIIMRDITKEQRMESIAEAVCVVNNLGYIFSGIRHEIGNPLNNIKMTISVLRENIGQFSEQKVLDYLDRSLGEIDRIEYLLRLLKTYNLYEKPDIRELNIYIFLKRFNSLVRADLEKRNIELVIDQSDQDLTAAADPRALHQVLLNLVTNATDALEGRADGHIVISVSAAGNHIAIVVTDNGHGMSEEHLNALFKPFVTHKSRGTGLGLVFSRRMLSKMGGTIEAESSEGMGTTMTITIPSKINGHEGEHRES